MDEFSIDCAEMVTKEKAHKYLSDTMKFPDYYGNNLDGLWDILSTIDDETKIIFKNRNQLIKTLPDYGEMLINVFIDAAQENEKLAVLFSD